MPLSKLQVEHLDHQRYRLVSPLVFQRGLNGDGQVSLCVPEGFETDFASIPLLLQWWLPFDGRWAKAAVIHDWLYSSGQCSRFLADALFREVMAETGVSVVKRVIIYYAVRLFGRPHFRRTP